MRIGRALGWAGTITGFLAFVPPASVLAQETGLGVISGVVADSLHGGPLVGAFVTVESLGRSAITDDEGEFRIDSVPPGQRRLAVFHPLLDTLGVTLMTPSLAVARDSTTVVVVAVPSASTVLRIKCGDEMTAAVLGTVSRADDPNPPVGASVMLQWTEVQVGRAIGLRSHKRELIAPVSADGTFRLCAVPPGVTGQIFAVASRDSAGVVAADTSATFEVSFEEWPVLTILGLVLAGSDVETVAAAPANEAGGDVSEPEMDAATASNRLGLVLRRGRALVSGVVVDSAGSPVSGVRVWIQNAVGSATSDAAGRFILREQPSGSGVLVARKLGYAMVEQPVVVSAHGRNEHTLRMSNTVVALSEVVVKANRQIALERVGFYSRQQRRRGNLFLDAEQMERMSNRSSLANVLASASNLTYRQGRIVGRYLPPRAVGLAGGQISMQSGYSCVSYVVDGELWREYGMNDAPTDYILPHEVAAIEVYRAGEAPRDLPFSHYVRGCETVVIWTRHKLRVQ